MNLVDLEDLTGLERAWAELERLRAVRALDPPLRANILRRLDRLDPDVAEPIRAALDEAHPDAVLAAYFKVLVPNRATIGAARASTRPQPPPPRTPSKPEVYRRVLADMVLAGWPEDVATEAVRGRALTDGMEPGAVADILETRRVGAR